MVKTNFNIVLLPTLMDAKTTYERFKFCTRIEGKKKGSHVCFELMPATKINQY